MEKYFKIGEISQLYNIGVDSLRYYEKLGLIVPKRAESGYRLYSVNDIWRLNVIRDLRDLGFGMEQIKEYLDKHTVDSTLNLLEEEQRAIEKKMQALKQLQENVEQRLETIRKAQSKPLEQITLQNYGARRCFFTEEGYSDEHEMDVLIKRLLNIDKQHFYVIGNNQIGTAIPRKVFETSGMLIYKTAFIIDKAGNASLPAGKYLSVSYQGNYQKSKEWAQKLLEYAKINEMKPIGDFLEILWIDIHTTADEEEQITELQILVE